MNIVLYVNIHKYVYIYIPGTCLSSILEFEPSKRRPFPIKTGVIWVPGINICYINATEIAYYIDRHVPWHAIPSSSPKTPSQIIIPSHRALKASTKRVAARCRPRCSSSESLRTEKWNKVGLYPIWAIYYKSLTWFKAILGGIPLLNHHLGWPRLRSLILWLVNG